MTDRAFRVMLFVVLLIWGLAQTLVAINMGMRIWTGDKIVAREIEVRSNGGDRKIVLSVDAVDGGIWLYGADGKTHCMLLPHESQAACSCGAGNRCTCENVGCECKAKCACGKACPGKER